MTDYLGTLLDFDERSYNASIAAYNKVIKAVDEVGAAYESLDTTFEFTDEVLKGILASKTEQVIKQYTEVVERQIQASKFTSRAIVNSMRESIQKDVEELAAKIENLFKAINEAGSGNNLYTISLDPADIRIINGKAVLPEEAKISIKDKFELKIRTENQNKLYNLALEMTETLDKITDVLREAFPIMLTRDLISYNGGLLYIQGNKLKLNNNLLTAVK